LSPSEMALSLVVDSLSKQSARVMDTIQQLGDAIPHGTPLGDSLLQLMDVVIELDSTITDTQHAVAYMNDNSTRSRLGRRSMEEAAELLQLRAEKTRWSEDRRQMQQKLHHVEQRLKCVRELNNMLMERAASNSSGFSSSASSSPQSDSDGRSELTCSTLSPVVEESAAVQSLDYTPERRSSNVDGRLVRAPLAARVTLTDAADFEADETIFLSESPDALNEGPLCSTFNDEAERSFYYATMPHTKNRRRSSSLGGIVRKMFAPHRKGKNTVLNSNE
ncbi:hypothetical protein PFISCL1PPCAC_26, partial [Pristionchus fissidentatus]